MVMDDLISRTELLKEFRTICGPYTGDGWDNAGVRSLIVRQKSVDAVRVVRCKNRKRFPVDEGDRTTIGGFGLVFPDDECSCKCEDGFYSWMPDDDWFCANGERRDDDATDRRRGN